MTPVEIVQVSTLQCWMLLGFSSPRGACGDLALVRLVSRSNALCTSSFKWSAAGLIWAYLLLNWCSVLDLSIELFIGLALRRVYRREDRALGSAKGLWESNKQKKALRKEQNGRILGSRSKPERAHQRGTAKH